MGLIDRVKKLFHTLITKISELNLFRNQSTDPIVLRQQIHSTRLFLILFGITFLILLSYMAINKQTTTGTVQQPNSATFRRLEEKYSSTLYCPCAHISIPYGVFVETQPLFHQVCSSDFVGEEWIYFIFGAELVWLWPMDLSNSLSAMWQLIAAFCQGANNTINDVLKELADESLISYTAFSETYLKTSVQAALENAQQTAVDRFTRDLTVIDTITQINDYMTGVGTNFLGVLTFGDDNIPYNALILEGMYQLPGRNDTCYCHRAQSCQAPAGFYPWRSMTLFQGVLNLNEIVPDITFPGLVFDCVPSQMVYGSSLECFYNRSCIDAIVIRYIGSSNVSILDENITSRFPPSMILKQIIDELFLEQIVNTTSFDAYYETCAPISCTYTYSHRFDSIFIITTLAGLVGGLYTVLHFISPFLIQGVLFVKRKLSYRTVQVQSNDNDRRRFEWRSILTKVKIVVMEFNIFEDSHRQEPANIHKGRIATRTYAVLLILTTLVLIIYTSESMQIYTKIVKSPAQTQYEMLQILYSDTLRCPCTVMSIPQQEFLEINPTYHQICSSDFVQPAWYQSLLYTLIDHSYPSFYGYTSSYFEALAFFCDMANQSFISAYNKFSLTKFVSAEVLPRSTFATKTNLLIETFLETTQAEFLYTVLLVTGILRVDQYASTLMTNTLFDLISLDRFTDDLPYLIYSSFQKYNRDSDYVCSCAKDPNCSMVSNYSGFSDVPQGISTRCQIVDTTLQSSFTCWHDKKCFDAVLNRSMVFNDHMPTNITLLNSNQSSRFLPNTTFQIIVNQFMVEYFNSSANYSSYYEKCQITSCTYTIEMPSDLIYIVTTIIGLLGGINVILRLLCPLIAKFLLKLSTRTNQTNISLTIVTQRRVNDRIHERWCQFRDKLVKFNLFPSGSLDIDMRRRELISTRVYLLFLLTSITIITIYTVVPINLTNKTIEKPSLLQYNDLISQYSETLHCPCSQYSIFYETFITSNYTNHQVCSSDFIKEPWILFLTTDNYSSLMSRNSFQTTGGACFQLLSMLCQFAQDTTQKAINQFLAEQFSSVEAVSEAQFLSQMADVTNKFQSSTARRFSHTIQLLRDFMQGNAFVSSYALNWYFWLYYAAYGEIIWNVPATLNDGCSCGIRSDCADPTPFASLMPEWVLGCSILETLLRSTLTVLYNQTSIDYLETYLTTNDSHNYPTRVHATAMNPSIISRFELNTSIQHIVDSLFIEEWHMNASFSSFYQQCAPLYCLYAVNERKNVLYVVSRILGLYGGLTITLRFMVPYLVQFSFKLKAYFRSNRVAPIHVR